MVTLDDEERILSSEHLLITNGKEAIALAGVMGGANTEVHDGTKHVLLEAAYFDPLTVRKASEHTGLRSDASNRFEKGVDTNRIHKARSEEHTSELQSRCHIVCRLLPYY